MKSSWKKRLLLIVFFLLCIGILCFLRYSGSHYTYQITQMIPDSGISLNRAHVYIQQFSEEFSSVTVEHSQRAFVSTRKVTVPQKTPGVDYHHKSKRLSRVDIYNLMEVEDHTHIPTPEYEKQIHMPELYVFSLSYMDQMTWASVRWRSLQCWAGQLTRYSIHIIEPFVIEGTHLGVPAHSSNHTLNGQEILKFSDIFDAKSWHRQAGQESSEIVTWDTFLSTGPRNVIVVQIVYHKLYFCTENMHTEEICSSKMQTFVTQDLKPIGFRLLKTVCINFRELDVLTIEEFNNLILEDVPENMSITILFDEWRGLNRASCFVRINDGRNCSVTEQEFIRMTLNMMSPSPRIGGIAQKFITQYLNANTNYVAVTVRWEKVLLYDFYWNKSAHYSGKKCVLKIVQYVMNMYKTWNLEASYLTTDVGKYGSSTLDLYNSTQQNAGTLVKLTEDLLSLLSISSTRSRLNEYEQRFEEISGTTNPAFISQLQKSIAARARCLLLVGWGNFLRNTWDLYKRLHKGQQLCYKRIELC